MKLATTIALMFMVLVLALCALGYLFSEYQNLSIARDQDAALIQSLRGRIGALESENATLKRAYVDLKRENEQLRQEKEEAERTSQLLRELAQPLVQDTSRPPVAQTQLAAGSTPLGGATAWMTLIIVLLAPAAMGVAVMRSRRVVRGGATCGTILVRMSRRQLDAFIREQRRARK